MGGIYLKRFSNFVPAVLVILYGSVLSIKNQSDSNWTISQNETQNSTDVEVQTSFALNTTEINSTESFNFTENSVLNLTTEEALTPEEEETTTPRAGANFWTEYSTSQREDEVPCVCDLLPAACDVNCCCDKLCSEEDRRVFISCGVPIPQPDMRYCYQEDRIFINNTPYVMFKSSNSLFCIQTDNYQARLQYKDIQTITDGNQFEQIVEKYLPYSWPEQPKNEDSELKVGSPVYVQFDDDSIGYLPLPRKLFTGECLSSNPTAYMIDEENVCYQIIKDLKPECDKNVWLSSRTYFQGFKIVRNPDYLKNSSRNSDDLLQVNAQICVNILETDAACSPIDESDFPVPSYDISSNACNNAVSNVRYELTHNGTRGIYSAEAKITLGSISNGDRPVKWVQRHAAVFQWAKENASFSVPVRRSGNPGYQTGAKILAGKLVTNDIGEVTSKDARLGVQVSQDDDNWLTVLGASPFTNGRCISQEQGSAAGSGRIPVEFGRELKSGCQLVVSLKNLTGMCAAFQAAALDALTGWDPPTVVGAYGNSNVSNPGDWVPILVQNKPSASRPIGNVACSNIVRELRIQILHANIGSLANPQAKIVGVQYRFGMPGELKLRCVGRYCQNGAENLAQRFAVTTFVTFVDISEPATPIYAEKPTIHVQLPNDFFYPFVSTSPKLQPNLFVIISTFAAVINSYMRIGHQCSLK